MLSRSISSEKPLYLSVFHFRLPEHVDVSRLRKAWSRVHHKSQILRTRFVATTDGFAQVALKGAELPWQEVATSSQQLAEVDAWYQANRVSIQVPLKIIVKMSPTETYLALCHHHALFDQWSHRLMLTRVAEEYHGVNDIDYGPSFFDILADGRLCEMEGAPAFWTQHLDDSQHGRLRLAHVKTGEPITVTRRIPGQRLEALRRRLRTTHQALIQTCWATVLRKYLGVSVNMGIVVSGRTLDLPDVDRTIGPLFNTIPFHVRLESSLTWAEVVRNCQEFNTSALPYQHTALRSIMKWCGRSSEQPLFEVLFSYQKDVAGDDAASDMFQFEREGSSSADVSIPILSPIATRSIRNI